MQTIAKLVRQRPPIMGLFIIKLFLFVGQAVIMMENPSTLLAWQYLNRFVRQDGLMADAQDRNQLSVQDAELIQSANSDMKTFSASPFVQPPNRGQEGNMKYAGGHVIDGIANVYLIFWQDPSSQPLTPKYVSLLSRLVTDIGGSPLYAMLSQYTDSQGRSPTGVKLAGAFVDTNPFPQALVRDLNQTKFDPGLMDQIWRQEIRKVAADRGLNTRNYHNVFALLPNARSRNSCGFHNVLSANGSPYLFVSFSSRNGRLVQGCNHSGLSASPNNDKIADVASSTLSHELIEVVTDPQLDAWGSNGSDNEIGDKCNNAPYGLNSTTQGNVTWNGHPYLIQREYNNNQQGCTLRGP